MNGSANTLINASASNESVSTPSSLIALAKKLHRPGLLIDPEKITEAEFKREHDDFFVEEDLQTHFTDQGEHVYLLIESTGLNSDDVIKSLASFANLSRRAIGYSGLKDKRARTRQWFSLHLPGRGFLNWSELPALKTDHQDDDNKALTYNSSLTVLKSIRHIKKLRRGQHHGNFFDLRLNAVKGDHQSIAARLDALAHGIPNYFGPQRFGSQGKNLLKAHSLDQIHSKRLRGLYLSAARSFLFNQILHQGIESFGWPACLAADQQQMQSAWLFGHQQKKHQNVTQNQLLDELADAVVARFENLSAQILTTDIKQARRPIVLKPEKLQYQWQTEAQLRLQFYLPTGTYATEVLANIFNQLTQKQDE